MYFAMASTPDRGAWPATIHGIAELHITVQLSRLTHTHMHASTHTHTHTHTHTASKENTGDLSQSCEEVFP